MLTGQEQCRRPMSYPQVASGTNRVRDEQGQSALESPRSTLAAEIWEGSVEEVALEIGLGNEEHRGGEAGWKEACTARRDEQE